MDQERIERFVVPRRHAAVELARVHDVVPQSGHRRAEHVAVHLADPRSRVSLGDEHVPRALERPPHPFVRPHLLGVLEPQRRGARQVGRVENLPAPDSREARSDLRVFDEHRRHLVVDPFEVAVEPRGDHARAGGQTALSHRQGLAQDHVRVQLHDPLRRQSVFRVFHEVQHRAGQVIRRVAIRGVDVVVRGGHVRGHEVQVPVRRERVLVARQKTRDHAGAAHVLPAPVQRDALPIHVRLAVRAEDVVVIVDLAGLLVLGLRQTSSCDGTLHAATIRLGIHFEQTVHVERVSRVRARVVPRPDRVHARLGVEHRAARVGPRTTPEHHPHGQQRGRGEQRECRGTRRVAHQAAPLPPPLRRAHPTPDPGSGRARPEWCEASGHRLHHTILRFSREREVVDSEKLLQAREFARQHPHRLCPALALSPCEDAPERARCPRAASLRREAPPGAGREPTGTGWGKNLPPAAESASPKSFRPPRGGRDASCAGWTARAARVCAARKRARTAIASARMRPRRESCFARSDAPRARPRGGRRL